MACLGCAGYVKGMLASPTRLILEDDSDLPIESPSLTPERLAGRTAREIARLPAMLDGRDTVLGELFAIEPGLADDVELAGDLARVAGIGAGMRHGRLVVRGPAGPRLGEAMLGGSILVEGDAGHGVGADMSGGLLAVVGRMGDEAGSRMAGGTIISFGGLGPGAGAGSTGGRIVAMEGMPAIPPTYYRSCTFASMMLEALYRQLLEWKPNLPAHYLAGAYHRYVRDASINTKGEILVFRKP